MSGKDDKRSKMHGEPVSKEEVLAELGDPAGWWSLHKKLDFEKHLIRGQTEPGIGGLRGYGRVHGYLAFLEKALQYPFGVGTGLVSEEEDARIRAAITEDSNRELATYRARLIELEKSPEAVAFYIDQMKSWLDFCQKTISWSDPEDEEIEELRELNIVEHARHLQEIETLKREIETYGQLLERLQAGTPSTS